MKRVLFVAVALVALALPGRAGAKDCQDVGGPFSAVPPPTCASLVHICTHGTLSGGLNATYDFVADSQTIAGTTANLTGHSTITTDKGAVLHGQDTSALSLVTGQFTTTVHIVGGTRKYSHATGTIVATGVFNFATGATAGTYTGTICKAKGDDGEDEN